MAIPSTAGKPTGAQQILFGGISNRLTAPAEDPIPFTPFSGPQTEAYCSDVDVIGFGGAAGGGKSFLMLALACIKHKRSLICRRQFTQMRQMIDDSQQMIGDKGDFNANLGLWQNIPGGRQIRFVGLDQEDDWKKQQGSSFDLVALDEATEIAESTARALLGWNRSKFKGQKAQALLCFNPPTTVEGEWIITFFAPWLDDDYPGVKAESGEVRWFARISDKDVEMPDNRPFVLVDNQPLYDFEAKDYSALDIRTPLSRTFIRAKVTDNPILMAGDYITKLQGLTEEMQQAMLHGKFTKRGNDGAFQLCPTALVTEAQQRWTRHGGTPPEGATLVSLGVDIARGGKDNTVITPLYEGVRLLEEPDEKGNRRTVERKVLHFGAQVIYPGSVTTDGQITASLVIQEYQPGAMVNVDAIGVGGSPIDFLRELLESDLDAKDPDIELKRIVHAINNGAGAPQVKDPKTGKMVSIKDHTGIFGFGRMRSFLAWRFREMLMDQKEYLVELPPSPELRSDLCTPKWEARGKEIKVESKDDVKARLPDRRSTDYGDSAILATAFRALPTTRKKRAKGCFRTLTRDDD